MPIPTYDALMQPVLQHCAERTWLMRDLIDQVATDLALTDVERAEEIPSGGTTVIASRVHWAKTYLKQAGLLEQPKRGVVTISAKGRDVLTRLNGQPVNLETLRDFPEFLDFVSRTKASTAQRVPEPVTVRVTKAPDSITASTPEEQIETAEATLSDALKDALLARILEGTPAFFERMIIDLLLAMGYGGSRTEAAEQLGGTGDGGVDGVIREDQLGLDRVYLQAKRYQPGNSVGSETVQAFMGALVGRGAHKGVLITTSSFSKPALATASQSGNLRLVLIDGDELTRLLIRFNVGVRVARTVEIKKVDLDYFNETPLE